MSPDRISKRALNRALLARQLLLDRSDLLMTEAVEHLVGLQAQVPITPYIGLWSRLRDFDPMALSDLLLQRWAVRAALMRSTLHLISARDLVGLQPVMADVLARTYASTSYRKDLQGLDLDAVLAAGRELVAERPRTRAEIARLLAARWPDRSAASIGQAVTYLLPLVQVTPRGLWGSTQAATWALADAWLEQADRADHRPYSPDEIVLRYLAAFGPSSSADVRAWSGMTGVREVVDRLRPQLRTFRDEGGRELFDLPDAPRPDSQVPAPPRFLPEYDNAVLAHADRTRIVAAGRAVPMPAGSGGVMGSFLVDGTFRGMWRLTRDGTTATLRIEPIDWLARSDVEALTREGEALAGFLAREADRREVWVVPLG